MAPKKKSFGTELFTLSKDQFNLYFDTLFRLRPEVKIDLFPDKKHVYVRSVDPSVILMSEMVLNIEPKEFLSFQIPLESVIKLKPKKDVVFFIEGNVVTLSNGDFALKVTTLDERTSQLNKCDPFPDLPHQAKLYLEKADLEAWYDYFKMVTGKEGVQFKVNDGELTVRGKVENEDYLEMNSIMTNQPDCEVNVPIEPMIDALAHWKVYDTVAIHIGDRMPLQLNFGSDLLNIRTIIAPIYNDE